MEEHLGLLGKQAEDKVTGNKGVITSVCFDLYGCIQASLTAPGVDNEGKPHSGYWYDVPRLRVLSENPVMEVPDFSDRLIMSGRKGAAEKAAT